MKKDQSIIDLIGWALILTILFSFFMLLFGCGTIQHCNPTVDDWAGAPTSMFNKIDYAQAIEPDFEENMIEWHGYIIIDVQDSLIVIKKE